MSEEEEIEVYDQSDTYEEDVTSDDVDEGDEEVEADADFDTIYGIPKKYVFLAAAAILLVLVAIIILKTRSSHANDVADDYVPPAQFDSVEGGDEELSLEDIPVFDNEDEVEFADVEEIEDTDSEPITVESLTDEQHEELRKLGYTGDEIDLILNNGVDYDTMVEHAKDVHDEESRESYKRAFDHASKEFKYIVTNTYFSQKFVKYTDSYEPYEQTTETIIADYVKCPTYGLQPTLKCKISDAGDCVFVVVDPYIYKILPPDGNVRINVTYRDAYGTKFVIGTELIVDDSLIVQTTDPETAHTILDETEKQEDVIKETSDAEKERLKEEAKEELRKELEEQLRKEQEQAEQEAAEQEEEQDATENN